MKMVRSVFAVVAAFVLITGLGINADAQRRDIKQVRDIVRSLASKIDDFQYGLSYQLKSSSADRADIDDFDSSLRSLQDAVSNFEDNIDQRRENRDDVSGIIDAAKGIDSFLKQNPQNRRVEQDWEGVRSLIDRLARQYGVTPDWNTADGYRPDRQTASTPKMSPPSVYDAGLNGTYTLDAAQSEKIADVLAGSRVGTTQRRELEQKLEAPKQIALFVRGDQVTLASTNAEPVTFIADGRDQAGSGSVRVRATLRGQQLTVASLGGDTDYTIVFTSADNGRTLKVTRRITTSYTSETIFAESVYNKTDQVAGLGIDPAVQAPGGEYSSNDPTDRYDPNSPQPTLGAGRTGEFVIPDGMTVTAMLESTIDTKASQNGDRFKLTVQSPDEFRGAVIEGFINGVGRSGRVSGSSNVTFNFESITLRNGRRYDFSGTLEAMKDQYGKDVKIDPEGAAKGDSQTKETVKRGGIGAGAGAIIGAIIGGGKGAAIGAVIGGSAGAGSVIVQGRDDLQLQKGSIFTIRSSSPVRGRSR